MGIARAKARNAAATLDRLTKPAPPAEDKTPATTKTKDSFNRVRTYMASHPTKEFRVADLIERLDISQTSLNRTINQLLGVGAIEKMRYGVYRACAGYKSIETVREEVKAHIEEKPAKVVLSETPFQHGTQNGITAVSNWVYFKRHCTSMRERMSAGHPLTESDLAAFDELQALAFGPEKAT